MPVIKSTPPPAPVLSDARQVLEHLYIKQHIQRVIDGPGIPRGDSVNLTFAIPDVIEGCSLKLELKLPAGVAIQPRVVKVSVPNPDDSSTWSYTLPRPIVFTLAQPSATFDSGAVTSAAPETRSDRWVRAGDSEWPHADSSIKRVPPPPAYVRELKQAEGYGTW